MTDGRLDAKETGDYMRHTSGTIFCFPESSEPVTHPGSAGEDDALAPNPSVSAPLWKARTAQFLKGEVEAGGRGGRWPAMAPMKPLLPAWNITGGEFAASDEGMGHGFANPLPMRLFPLLLLAVY